jgi:3',5'-cyclic AMP phosphodiesterase CpdA
MLINACMIGILKINCRFFFINCISIVFLSFLFISVSIAQTAIKDTILNSELTLKIDNTALNFLAFGDWGRNGEYHQKNVAEKMGEIANSVKARFIVSTGDNIYPSGVISEFDPAFRYSFEDIYTAHSLQCDWYLVLGNHDYKTKPEAEIAYSGISRRWKMPGFYYSKKFTINKDPSQQVLMVFIDSNPFYKEYYNDPEYIPNISKQDTLAQKKWLEKVLCDTASNIKWKIVVSHHPLYTGGPRISNPNITGIRSSLKNIIDKYKVDVFLSGHEHNLQHIVPDGLTHYFISGAGSELTPVQLIPQCKFAASENGFMVFTLTRDQLLVQIINYQGKILYQTKIIK